VGVGNGLTDPEIQYAYYGQMAYNNSYGIEAVDQATFNQMQAAVPKCTNLIHKCQANDAVSYYSHSHHLPMSDIMIIGRCRFDAFSSWVIRFTLSP
jgi:carboxypeptidase C (cathepsin A)